MRVSLKEFYIIPSSVHETLLLARDARINDCDLNSMVREVNSTAVAEMEILSDRVYSYPENMFRITA